MYEKERVIQFAKMQDVEEFVDAADRCDFEIDVFYRRAVIDAKSILGMLGIGLKKELIVRYGGRNEHFENIVNKFQVA